MTRVKDFGWSLPPGVTDKMIEEAYGWGNCCEDPEAECDTCHGTGEIREEDPSVTDDALIPCYDCDSTGHTCVEPAEPDADAEYEAWRERRDER